MANKRLKVAGLTIFAVVTAITLAMVVITMQGPMSVEGQTSGAMVDPAYIKFEGVDGESQDKDHLGWSDVLSFDQVIHSPASGTSMTRTRESAILEDIRVVKELDKSSPKLAEAICKGVVYPTVQIHLVKAYSSGPSIVYYAYELKNALVTSYVVGGATGGIPTEEISLAFEEIKVTYTEVDSTGSSKGNIEYTWKVETAEP
jgi:type VI secretion system secreted protein Hcp